MSTETREIHYETPDVEIDILETVVHEDRPSVWIVIPAYNEEKVIGDVIAAIRQAGYGNILVVDDGSKDATNEKAKETGVIALRHRLNRGKGAATKTGIEAAKLEGADIIVTQLFYVNEDYFRFRDKCSSAGIHIPIVPGILPVTNLAQIKRIASMCKANLPDSFLSRLGESDEADWQFSAGVEFAQRQVAELLNDGVPGIHFYVLNKSQATAEVLKAHWFVS